MGSVPATVAALLNVASDLVEQSQPDGEVILELLHTLSLCNFDMPTRLAVAHAQKMTAASLDGNAIHATIARCALARVVALLERRVAVTVALS